MGDVEHHARVAVFNTNTVLNIKVDQECPKTTTQTKHESVYFLLFNFLNRVPFLSWGHVFNRVLYACSVMGGRGALSCTGGMRMPGAGC